MAKFTAVTEKQADGLVTVTAFVNGKEIHGWLCRPALVARLVAAIEAGAAFEAVDAETVRVNGAAQVFPATWSPRIMGRYMNSDLTSLGF